MRPVSLTWFMKPMFVWTTALIAVFLCQGCSPRRTSSLADLAITNGRVVLLLTNSIGYSYSGSSEGGTYRDDYRILEVRPDRVLMGGRTHFGRSNRIVVDLTSASVVLIDGVPVENAR